MKRRFDVPMLLLTLALSTAGMLICLPLRESLSGSAPGRATWCAIWFALPLTLGLLGVEAGLALQYRRFRPVKKRSLLAGLLAAVLLGAALGHGGGMLCMLEYQTVEAPADPAPPPDEDREEDPLPPDESSEDPEEPDIWEEIKHVVMLIDASDSARLKNREDRLAPCRLIDKLGGDVSMQAAVFAYALTAEDVRYKTEYLPLEDEVKEEFKEFVQNADVVGGTSFEGPLRLALETLEGRFSDEEPAAIVMFTDGNSPLSAETRDAVKRSGVRLILLRAEPARTSNAKQLVQLAEETGGGDLPISVTGGGSAAASGQSYTESAKPQAAPNRAETRRELAFGESLPPDGLGEDIQLWRTAVCIITYILYAILATVVYYRRLTLAGLAGSLCAGCLTVLAATLDPRLCIPATAILLLGAYTIYEVKEETTHV